MIHDMNTLSAPTGRPVLRRPVRSRGGSASEAARRPLPPRLFRPKWHHLLHFARGTRGARRRARRPPHHRDQRQLRGGGGPREDRLRSRQFRRRNTDEDDADVDF